MQVRFLKADGYITDVCWTGQSSYIYPKKFQTLLWLSKQMEDHKAIPRLKVELKESVHFTFSTKRFKSFAMRQNQNHVLRNIQCHKNVKKLQIPWWATCSLPAPKTRLLIARQNALDMMASEGLCRRSDLSIKILRRCFEVRNEILATCSNFRVLDSWKTSMFDRKTVLYHGAELNICNHSLRQAISAIFTIYSNQIRKQTYCRKAKVNDHENLRNIIFFNVSVSSVI